MGLPVCVALPRVHRCALSRQVSDLIRQVAGLLRQVNGHIRQVAILIRLFITVQCFHYYTAGGVTNMYNNIRQCKNTRKSISLATYPHTSSHNHAISTPIIYSYRCTLSLIITKSNLCMYIRINNIQWALCTYKTMPYISSMKTDEITCNSVGKTGKAMMVLAVF